MPHFDEFLRAHHRKLNETLTLDEGLEDPNQIPTVIDEDPHYTQALAAQAAEGLRRTALYEYALRQASVWEAEEYASSLPDYAFDVV